MSDIQTLMRSANPIPDARTEFSPEDLDALLLLTQQRSGDMDLKEETTPIAPEKPRRRWLIAAAAFVVVVAVVATGVLLTRPSDEIPPATPTTTIPPEELNLESLLEGPTVVAQQAGYSTEIVAWSSQLDYAGFPPTCQAADDPIDLQRLGTITSGQSMARFSNGAVVGHIEALRFSDPAVAGQAGEILGRLFDTRRECISSKLQFQLGDEFTEEQFSSIGIAGTLGGYGMTSTHHGDSGLVAHIEAIGVVDGADLFIISFSSNEGFVGETLLADLARSITVPPSEDASPPTTVAASSSTTVPQVDAAAVAFIDEYAATFNSGDYQAAADMLIAAAQFDAPGETDQERAENSRDFHQINSELGTAYTVDDCRALSSGITQCRLSRSAAEIEAHHPHPETSLIRVRFSEDGTLAYVGLSAVQTDPWWTLNQEFTEWAANTYDTREAPFTAVFVSLDPETYPAALEEIVTRWRAERDG